MRRDVHSFVPHAGDAGDYEGALAEAEQALAAAPNMAFAHHMLGATLIFSGRPKEGVAAL